VHELSFSKTTQQPKVIATEGAVDGEISHAAAQDASRAPKRLAACRTEKHGTAAAGRSI